MYVNNQSFLQEKSNKVDIFVFGPDSQTRLLKCIFKIYKMSSIIKFWSHNICGSLIVWINSTNNSYANKT